MESVSPMFLVRFVTYVPGLNLRFLCCRSVIMSHLLHSENVTPLHLGSGDADERATVANFEPVAAPRAGRADGRGSGGEPGAVEATGPEEEEAACRQRRGRTRSWQRGTMSEAQDDAGRA